MLQYLIKAIQFLFIRNNKEIKFNLCVTNKGIIITLPTIQDISIYIDRNSGIFFQDKPQIVL